METDINMTLNRTNKRFNQAIMPNHKGERP